jgi:raffinose synthase
MSTLLATPPVSRQFASPPLPFSPPETTRTDFLGSLPPALRHAAFITFTAPGQDLPAALGAVTGLSRFLATARINPWSLAPHFGTAVSGVPDETLMLLWEKTEGGYGLLLPLVHAGQRAWLAGTPEGLELRSMAWDRAAATGPATLLLSAEGDDPFALVEAAVSLAAERLRSFRPRAQKATPEWVDWFGWCTWDAFYYDVNTEGVLAGLEKAKAGGVQPRFMILDDGWQDTDGKMLQGFGAHPKKIPACLADLVARVKSEYGIRLFGAWHAFEGYWYGVDPQSPAGRGYRVFDITQSAHNRPTDEPARRALIHPDDVARFYHDYYRELRAAGVDFVKVDNQGSLDHFLNETTTPPTATMQRYQEAFQSAAAHHFRGETLHCLSQVGDVLFHLDSGNVMRNSEDYFPKRPATQGQHVFRNALNNVLMAPFCLPDWDMFQSCQAPAPFHAAARAICGGPVYISDKPGEQDFALLRKLVTRAGRVLRCPQPALPTRDCLFDDAYGEPRLFKIQNRNADTGVLGLFNCHWDESGGQPVSGRYSAGDVDRLPGERFALLHHSSGAVRVATRGESFEISLPPLGWELVTVAPIEHGVAVFGLADKLNGSAAITAQRWLTPTLLEITLVEGGPLALHLERELLRATVSETGAILPLKHNNNGVALTELPAVASPTLVLEFAA